MEDDNREMGFNYCGIKTLVLPFESGDLAMRLKSLAKELEKLAKLSKTVAMSLESASMSF